MSHFYARIPTSARKAVATARGHKATGISVEVASWDGGIRVTLEHDEATGKDHYRVEQIAWQGEGAEGTLCTGVVGEPDLTAAASGSNTALRAAKSRAE